MFNGNNKLSYSFDLNVFFEIDLSSGVVMVINDLDREIIERYFYKFVFLYWGKFVFFFNYSCI